MQTCPDWPEKCEQPGFTFHNLPSEEGQPYCNESAAYKKREAYHAESKAKNAKRSTTTKR